MDDLIFDFLSRDISETQTKPNFFVNACEIVRMCLMFCQSDIFVVFNGTRRLCQGVYSDKYQRITSAT